MSMVKSHSEEEIKHSQKGDVKEITGMASSQERERGGKENVVREKEGPLCQENELMSVAVRGLRVQASL